MNAMFVYGLLKPGYSLYHVVEPFIVSTEAGTVRGRLYDAGVPAARFDEDGRIEGFVYTLAQARLEDALRALDDLEDEGTEYRRVVVDVTTAEAKVQAWGYEYLLPLDGCRDVGSFWA